MTDKKRDLLCSVIFLAFGIFMFVQSAAIKPLMGSKDLGSGFVPKIIAGCIIVIAGVKLIMTLTRKRLKTMKIRWADCLRSHCSLFIRYFSIHSVSSCPLYSICLRRC